LFARLAAENVGKTGQIVASRKVISDAVGKVNSLIFGFASSHLSPSIGCAAAAGRSSAQVAS
jgi:hypothetical protein